MGLSEVLDRGGVRQIAPTEDLFQRPTDLFVADFVSSPALSVIEGRVRGSSVEVDGGALILREAVRDQDVQVGVFAHHWEIVDAGGIPVTISGSEFLGDHFVVSAGLGSRIIRIRMDADPPPTGSQIQVYTHRYLLFTRGGRRLATVA